MSTPTILSQLTGDSARARLTDPETSHAAADSITLRGIRDSEAEVLGIIRGASRPICAQQVEEAHDRRAWAGEVPYHYSPSRLRSALKKLAEAALIVKDGETRTRSKRRADTWRAAE